MSTQAMSFSGIVPTPTRRPIVAPRPSTATTVAPQSPSRGLRPAHTANPLIVVHFSHGRLDGAEGIDGAEI